MPPVPVFIYRKTKSPEKPHFLQNHGFGIYTFATFTNRHNILCFLSFQTTSYRAPLLFFCFFASYTEFISHFADGLFFQTSFLSRKRLKNGQKPQKTVILGLFWGFFRAFYTVPRETFSFPNVFSECFT